MFVAYDLFKKGMECLKVGNMSEAVPALQSCYQIRQEKVVLLLLTLKGEPNLFVGLFQSQNKS